MTKSRETRVLLVDDDIDVLGAHSRFLRLNDIDVIVAESSATALQRLLQNDIDIIVTDLRMPEGSGIEFAQQARLSRPLVPIIFFSGYAEVSDVVTAMKLGAVEFLEKPINPDELLEIISTLQQSHYRSLSDSRKAFDGLAQEFPLRIRVLAYEKYLIESAIIHNKGQIGPVLKSLQINRRTLNDKMSKLGISRDALLGDSNH
ncbi:hypothetical protein AB833_02750 [Chromatiales bacterium (ex Bugula neritina AB1)]|nr:hypothetical protein AB833_02750 [Chromatiales bacterium (ex Bugula neritina AB1)]